MKILNSKEYAVDSKWSNPGAKFYDKIHNDKEVIKEAYLIIGDTDKPFSSSGCKYPHHSINKNGDLVLNIAGLKAAYQRAKQMGVVNGEIKEHLIRHYKELGLYKDSTLYSESVIMNNFLKIEASLGINESDYMIESEESSDVEELADWIDNAAHNGFESYDEASHGKLKYDFRMGWDYDTGHQIKVVYELQNIQIDDIGDFYYKYHAPEGTTKDSHMDYVKKNISTKGNTDHQSSGQKVLNITDLVTKKRLESCKLLSPFTPGIDTHNMIQSEDDLKEARRNADSNSNYLSKITVGEIDKKSSFKSTSWYKGMKDDPSKENFRFNQIASAEELKDGRGWKTHNIHHKPIEVFGSDQKYVRHNNPNKKQALNELYIREKDILNYLRMIRKDHPEAIGSKGYNIEIRNLQIIQNDIKRIENGEYNLQMMDKYHKESANPDNDDIIMNRFYIKSDDGVDNCCVIIKGYDKPMRGRSSMILLRYDQDGVKVLCRDNNDGSYGVPGGGWDKGETSLEAAKRELGEEVQRVAKDIIFMGTLIEYRNSESKVADWVKQHVDKKDWWYGYYSEIFVGIDNGEYDKPVNDKDKESGFKWIDINTAIKQFPKEYVTAVKEYINSKNKVYNYHNKFFNEAEDKSVIDKNFKKKDNKILSFTTFDIHDKKALPYIKNDSYLQKINLSELNGEIIVDLNEDNIIGRFLVMTGKNEGFIGSVRVYGNYKGYGFGHMLIDDAINKYNGTDLIVLRDNEVAIKLYKSHGFVPIGYGDNENEFWMKLKSKLNKNDKIITESVETNDIMQMFIEDSDNEDAPPEIEDEETKEQDDTNSQDIPTDENETSDNEVQKEEQSEEEKDIMDEDINSEEEEENPTEEPDQKEELSQEDEVNEEPVKEEKPVEKPLSLPKQTDAKESGKNGVRRKQLYIAFIEWAKEFNSKNTFGSVFDKDVFHNVYPFVPEEMRYFYRLANPILCILAGDLTFFQVSELRSINKINHNLDKMMIFAATQKDLRVFNIEDKQVYLAEENDDKIELKQVLGSTFDIYIQNMIKKGDILNAPLEDVKKEELVTESVDKNLKLDIVKKFNDELNKWDYGVLINGEKYTDPSKIDWDKYKTIPINEIEKHHVGTCWDFVNYQHAWFKKNNIKDESYLFIMQLSDDPKDIVTHTFSIIIINNTKYWFESSWMIHQGLWKVSSYKDPIDKLIENYDKDHCNNYSVFKYNPNGLDKNISNGDFFNKATRNLIYNHQID